MRQGFVALAALVFASMTIAETGTFPIRPTTNQANISEVYRLPASESRYTLTPKRTLSHCGVRVDRLTYPSPVESPHECNNTVYADYYRTLTPGCHPAVVVLDITGGDGAVSRTFSLFLAQNDINALYVQMAYYGPRRPARGKVRMMSTNVLQTVENVRQTVLDCRVAAHWLAARPEVDADRIGVMGTSLGSFVAALAAEMEPRFGRVAILLGGGGLVDAFYDHPQAAPYRKIWEALGGTKAGVKRLLAPADPITRADLLRDRQVLMIAAQRDDIVPPSAARALHAAAGGSPRLVWFDTTHYGAALFLVPALKPVVELFGAERSPPSSGGVGR